MKLFRGCEGSYRNLFRGRFYSFFQFSILENPLKIFLSETSRESYSSAMKGRTLHLPIVDIIPIFNSRQLPAERLLTLIRPNFELLKSREYDIRKIMNFRPLSLTLGNPTSVNKAVPLYSSSNFPLSISSGSFPPNVYSLRLRGMIYVSVPMSKLCSSGYPPQQNSQRKKLIIN